MDLPTTAVIAIVVPLVIGWVTRSAKAQAVTVDGRTQVAYGGVFKGMAVLAGLMALAPTVGMFFAPDAETRWAMLVVAFVLGLPAVYLLGEAFFVRVAWTGEGIHASSPWRRDRFVPWQDVRGVSFSGGARWFRISTARSGYIRVHEMKSGVATLLDELKARGFRVR